VKRAGPALVALLLVGLAFWLRGRGGPGTPEATVQSWYEAAGRGDDRAWLARTGGALKTTLESTRAQQGADVFRQSLRDSVSGLRGVAVSRAADSEDGRAVLEVELVFANRNEKQRVILSPAGNGWQIVELGSAGKTQPPIPYGTKVGEE
jgi:hypothetical protein